MKTYNVKYEDSFEAVSEEEAYDLLLNYLRECVTMSDVTAFDFKEESEAIKAEMLFASEGDYREAVALLSAGEEHGCFKDSFNIKQIK